MSDLARRGPPLREVSAVGRIATVDRQDGGRTRLAKNSARYEHVLLAHNLWVSFETALPQEQFAPREPASNQLSRMINHSSTLKATLFAPPNQGARDLCRSPCDAHTPQVHARSRFVVRARFSLRAAGRPRGGQAEVSLLRDRGWERPFSTKKDHFSTPKPPPLQPPSAAKSNGHLSVPDIHRVRTAADPRKPAAFPRRAPS